MTIGEFAGDYHLPLTTANAVIATRFDMAFSEVGDYRMIPGRHGCIVESLDNPGALMALITSPKPGLHLVTKARLVLAGMRLVDLPTGDRLADAMTIRVEFNPANVRHAWAIIRMIGLEAMPAEQASSATRLGRLVGRILGRALRRL
jgi:hypothetical protein